MESLISNKKVQAALLADQREEWVDEWIDAKINQTSIYVARADHSRLSIDAEG